MIILESLTLEANTESAGGAACNMYVVFANAPAAGH